MTRASMPVWKREQPSGAVATRVRVLVVAHVRLYREALASVLAGAGPVEPAGVAGSPDEVVAAVAALAPDVVLLDPSAPGSLELIRELAGPQREQRVRVVVVASPEPAEELVAYAEAGAAGFVMREDSADELVATIVRAARGDLVVSPQAAGALLRRLALLAAERAAGGPGVPLTPREAEVARLLDEGLSNKQIAARLQLELPTVKHHVHHILHKVGAASRSEAVARLRRAGLNGAPSTWTGPALASQRAPVAGLHRPGD